MSAPDNPWPAWLRRHTGVELLGPPRLFFAWLTIALSLLMIVYVGAWNATRYPIVLGYDARPNIEYAHALLDEHHVPSAAQTGESNQPPTYYLVAGLASRAGHELFGWLEARPFTAQLPEASYRGAELFNLACVLLTALCVLWLARLVAPRTPWVWATSVCFFAFLPVVSKTEAMFHPENLNMLAGATAITSATAMLRHRRFPKHLIVLLLVSLALGLATRASTLFVVVAVVLGFALAMRERGLRQQVPWRGVTISFGLLLCVALLWTGYGAARHHNGAFAQVSRLLHSAAGGQSVADVLASNHQFFSVSPVAMFTTPWRSHYVNEAFPETYTEIWGDWLGAFAWSGYSAGPSTQSQRVLKDQNLIGVVPTVLALAGWLAMLWLCLTRRRDLSIVALLPLVAMSGYLYRSWLALTRDGDLFKASYLLNTAPVWAVCFGLATAWIASRTRLGRYTMIALFVAFAVLELRFMMYGIRDARPIF